MSDMDDLLAGLEADAAQTEAALTKPEPPKKPKAKKSDDVEATTPDKPAAGPESDKPAEPELAKSEPAQPEPRQPEGEGESEDTPPLSWLQKQQSFDPEQFLSALQELRGLIEERTNALSEELAAVRDDVNTLMTTDEEFIDDEIIQKPAPAKPETAQQESVKEPAQAKSASSASTDLGIPAYRDPWFALLVAGAAMLCTLAVGVGYGYMLSDKHLPFWGWQVLSAPAGLLLFPLAGAVLLWHGSAVGTAGDEKLVKSAGKYRKSGVALVLIGLLLAVAVFFA